VARATPSAQEVALADLSSSRSNVKLVKLVIGKEIQIDLVILADLAVPHQ
jgi:hypothetical protein